MANGDRCRLAGICALLHVHIDIALVKGNNGCA